MDNNQKIFTLGKTDQISTINAWFEHPVTLYMIAVLAERAKNTKKAVLYDDPPGMFDPRFLLREQLIGEQRGLEAPVEIITNYRDKLIEEETDKEKENNVVNENEQENEIN